MTTISLFLDPLIGAITWALLHFLWQGSLVALLLALAGTRPLLRDIALPDGERGAGPHAPPADPDGAELRRIGGAAR
jgi:hypothetical protein